jgi:gliding motility-associated-like protein
LNLTVNPQTFSTINQIICEPNSYLGYNASGTYIDTLVNTNGCDSIRTLNLIVNPRTYSTFTQTICAPNAYWGYTQTGIYKDTFANANGCDSIRTLNLTVNPQTFSTIIDTICLGDTLLGYTSSGIYIDTLTNANGCDSIRQLQLNVQRVQINATMFDIACYNQNDGRIQITPLSPGNQFTYTLNPGNITQQNGLFSLLPPGVYTLQVVDNLGCQLDTTLAILPDADSLNISINKKDLPCIGTATDGEAEAIINAGKPPFVFAWSTSPVQTNALAENLTAGWYTVTVIDGDGCETQDTVYINPGNCCDQVFIPNAFSPNGDGRNDLFRITSSTGIKLNQFEIYNRWGTKLWKALKYTDGWDGIYNGEQQQIGTYFYVFKYTCLSNGQQYILSGDLTLVR